MEKKEKKKTFISLIEHFFSFNEIYSLFEKLMKGNEKKRTYYKRAYFILLQVLN